MIKRVLLTLGATAALLAVAGPAFATPLRVESQRQIGDRLTELHLRTPSVEGATGVRVLLPRGYEKSKRRYPVLYLLHGALDGYPAWTDKGGAADATAGLPLIVVMPDSGRGGGYTDWYNGGAGGPPAWESYHVGQLIPFIDRRYRTRADRAGRAVAGLSMGGGGAMAYAARHPGLFTAAASFSGAVDLTNPAIVAVTGPKPSGPYLTQEVRWRGRNPVDLAPNLRGLDLTIRAGNGLPGGPLGGTLVDPVELVTHQASTTLHRRLDQIGVDHVWDDYGAGSHTWPYWSRGLRQTLPGLMRRFARRPAPPRRITFTATEPSYGAYGWRVAVRRPALEFSTLTGARRGGFALTGSGAATVTTPAVHRRCAPYAATIADATGRRTVRLRADRRGRLATTVGLGPANRYQQFTLAARSTAHRSQTATVRFRRSAGRARCGVARG